MVVTIGWVIELITIGWVLELLDELSYSNSFIGEALKVAQKKGLADGLWVTLQYDFEYEPAKVERKIAKDPVYLGSFYYRSENS